MNILNILTVASLSLSLAGCFGVESPSEEQVRETFLAKYTGEVSDDNKEVVINITMDKEAGQSDYAQAVKQYGDKLAGFGHANIQVTVTYKKDTMVSNFFTKVKKLRTSGEVKKIDLSIISLKGFDTWQIHNAAVVSVKETPASASVIEANNEHERALALAKRARESKCMSERKGTFSALGCGIE